jgi:hypothetical protein
LAAASCASFACASALALPLRRLSPRLLQPVSAVLSLL